MAGANQQLGLPLSVGEGIDMVVSVPDDIAVRALFNCSNLLTQNQDLRQWADAPSARRSVSPRPCGLRLPCVRSLHLHGICENVVLGCANAVAAEFNG